MGHTPFTRIIIARHHSRLSGIVRIVFGFAMALVLSLPSIAADKSTGKGDAKTEKDMKPYAQVYAKDTPKIPEPEPEVGLAGSIIIAILSC